MGCPALELAGHWVELCLSVEMEISGRAPADWCYVGPGGLWWTSVLNSALPSQRPRPDSRPEHQDRVSHTAVEDGLWVGCLPLPCCSCFSCLKRSPRYWVIPPFLRTCTCQSGICRCPPDTLHWNTYIHGGERYANSVSSLQFRDWDSLSLHVAMSGAAGQWSQSDNLSDSNKAFCSPQAVVPSSRSTQLQHSDWGTRWDPQMRISASPRAWLAHPGKELRRESPSPISPEEQTPGSYPNRRSFAPHFGLCVYVWWASWTELF